MTEKDMSILLNQMQNIILNKPVVGELEDNSPLAIELQQTISYLSGCLMELNQFLGNLAKGNLEVDLPGRHNFLVGDLKQLHSGLKHLTWQTNQVVKGDYKQRIDFMGEFSQSFNEMIIQLEKREKDLKEQTKNVVAIINCLKDWVLVTEEGTGEILYANHSAKKQFSHSETCVELMDYLKHYKKLDCELQREFECCNKVLYVGSYSLLWANKIAFVHVIKDITFQRKNEVYLEKIAYKDVLTGLDNRRSCLRTIDEYIHSDISFSLCMIDMDGLKNINDQYGHLYGDEYLKTVARNLKENTRTGDFTSRFGGDEFVVLMPGCKEESAKEKLKQIDEKLAVLGNTYSMSISYGVVYISSEQQISPEEALDLADEEMYSFKRLRKEKKNGAYKN